VSRNSSSCRHDSRSRTGQGLADTARALSAALAARRRAAGLTQPQLADLAEVSVTTVGHAETGRLWHSRAFWERADKELSAGGELLRLHDAYRAAVVPPATQAEPDQEAEPMSEAETTQAPPPAGLLTPDEHQAVQQADLLYTLIADRIVADGPTRDDDLAEIRAAIHLIQRAVLAQAAARAHPSEFRLLGTVIARQDDATNGRGLTRSAPPAPATAKTPAPSPRTRTSRRNVSGRTPTSEKAPAR